MGRRRKDEPSWRELAGIAALLLFAWIGWKSGLFNALGDMLVNHSMQSMKDAGQHSKN